MDGNDFRKAVIDATEYLAFFVKNVCTFSEPIEVEGYKGEKKKVIPTICLMEVLSDAPTGLFDKTGREIKIGDKTKLVLEDGEVRIFDVCFKTVTRTVKCHPDFDDEYSKVNITGVVFCWNGYDLFPCVNEKGVSDVSRMEII